MNIEHKRQERLTSAESEDALLSKCLPQVQLTLGYSKHNQQPRNFYFVIQSSCADILSCSCQRMMQPSGDP